MLRESAIVERLHAAGARVPDVLAVCDDTTLLGVPFYVMELAPGVPIDTAAAGGHRYAGRPRATGRGVRRRAGRDPRDRSRGGRPGLVRPAGRLPRAADRPVPEDLAAQRHPRPARGRLAGRLDAREPAARRARDRRPRRLPGRQPAGGRGRAGAHQRGAGLGAVDDRRPARRPRLPDVDVRRRHRARARPSGAVAGHAASRVSRAAPSWRTCTRRAPGATSRASPGTSAWRTGRPRCSSRTCGSGTWPATATTTFARSMEHGVPAKLAAAEAAAARDQPAI